MSSEPDPARLLLRALRRSAAEAGHTVTIEHEEEAPWSSATFVGAQHRLVVAGDSLDAWLATLAEADLPLRGHFVASLDVTPTRAGALLLILVLEA